MYIPAEGDATARAIADTRTRRRDLGVPVCMRSGAAGPGRRAPRAAARGRRRRPARTAARVGPRGVGTRGAPVRVARRAMRRGAPPPGCSRARALARRLRAGAACGRRALTRVAARARRRLRVGGRRGALLLLGAAGARHDPPCAVRRQSACLVGTGAGPADRTGACSKSRVSRCSALTWAPAALCVREQKRNVVRAITLRNVCQFAPEDHVCEVRCACRGQGAGRRSHARAQCPWCAGERARGAAVQTEDSSPTPQHRGMPYCAADICTRMHTCARMCMHTWACRVRVLGASIAVCNTAERKRLRVMTAGAADHWPATVCVPDRTIRGFVGSCAFVCVELERRLG